ncbi:hypothetical protein SAMN06265360_1131 [Haloechinothrix alba]|uniref:Lysyl oxidase n=1 Tax=Haloechinothrix alba TaxID=664784 RepID=A0A238XZY1_9PSEU|nr:hypothetical protein [Haloechinothrix alba]SNR64262.1 hypothetical protein SAMN06265360_1131 [Haloechinothrix alba]
MSKRSRVLTSLVTGAVLTLASVTTPAVAGAGTGDSAPPDELVDQFDVQETDTSAEITGQRTMFGGGTETTIRVGPITAEPHEEGEHGAGDGHGTTSASDDGPHGPEERDHGTHTTVAAPVPTPCWVVSCYVTSMEPDLTYADGSSANYDTNIMLHHAVLFDRSRQDVTCRDEELGMAGQRIFASGNERTGGMLPDGYGVPLGPAPLTWSVIELMNFAPESQEVYFDLTIEHEPALFNRDITPVTPVWLDAANCTFDSYHSVPEGESVTTWQWESTIAGTFHAAGGHVHDGGESLTLHNRSTGEEICPSYAGYGTDPAYQGHIESMSVCSEGDLGDVAEGDVLELESVYDSHYAQDDAMSIMIGYVEEDS